MWFNDRKDSADSGFSSSSAASVTSPCSSLFADTDSGVGVCVGGDVDVEIEADADVDTADVDTANADADTADADVIDVPEPTPVCNDALINQGQDDTKGGAKKKALSRRGHFKSRLGCFSCKRRRVKCDEMRPCCSQCRRLTLTCSYPSAVPTTASSNSSAALVTGPFGNNPSVLTLEDLRFYHQFLTKAFPTLPFRDSKAWLECSAMSHQYQCLSHAVLALGASHLTAHGNQDYSTQALNHRIQAISLLNAQFENPPTNAMEADALFGAVICLTTQTTLLPDGMQEYLTMIRGASIVMQTVVPSQERSLFARATSDEHMKTLLELASDESRDFTQLEEFAASLANLKLLCTKAHEQMHQEWMEKVVQAMYVSAREAWISYAKVYQLHFFFSMEEYTDFISPENYCSQLLIMHMFLLDYVLGPLCVSKDEPNNFPARRTVIVGWAKDLLRKLPYDLRPYGAWIKRFCDEIDQGDGRYLLTP